MRGSGKVAFLLTNKLQLYPTVIVVLLEHVIVLQHVASTVTIVTITRDQ